MTYDLAKKLIESFDFYLAAERKEILPTVLKLIASELEGPTTQLVILTQADLLRKMMEAKLVTLSKAQASQWQELRKLAAMHRNTRRERPSVKDFCREFESAEKVRPQFLELVSSLR